MNPIFVNCLLMSIIALKNSKNGDQQELQTRHLEEGLVIQEILTRLPVKSIICFKTVSKEWYSNLSSSVFANDHLRNSPITHSLLVKDMHDFYIVPFDDANVANYSQDNIVKLDFEFYGYDKLYLIGCCNGLVCVAPYYGQYFILWNPATRKLQRYSDDFVDPSSDLKHYTSCGLGYASSVDDYKFARIIFDYKKQGTTTVVHVFSLKMGRFYRVDFGLDHKCVFRAQSVHHNGNIYWIVYGSSIAAFDLEFEIFSTYPDHILMSCDPERLSVVRGCLSWFSIDNQGKTLHIVKDAGEVSSVSIPKIEELRRCSLVGFSRTGKLLVCDRSNANLQLVDYNSSPIQLTTLLSFEKNTYPEFEVANYFPSLISPFSS